ncbi:MAG TPA: FAD-dependent oxidoreductase [Solirubrobacterales bacterium]|jgi:NADH dehydrogenase FAD-containing subunit
MSTHEQQRIVVIGGGYAGTLAAVRLAGRARGSAAVTLLDPRGELVQRLRLHQLATGQKVRSYDLARLTGRRVENVRGRAVAIDPDRGRVAVDHEGELTELPFDQVLLAAGSGFDLDRVPGVREHAHSLGDVVAAERLWEDLRELVEGSRVIVCGGGFTGIEAAAEIAGRRPELRVSLLSAGRPGAGLSARGREELEKRLARKGVEPIEGERATAVEPGKVVLAGGGELDADLVVWCGGFTAPPLVRDSGLPVDSRGLLAVDSTLRSVGHDNVIGAGDVAAIPDLPNGAPYRMTCQAGMPSGAHAADAALATLRGEQPQPFDFGYFHMPLSLGRGDGLIQFVDRDDRPKDKLLVGRRAAIFKELVTRSPASSIAWEGRLPGMLRWPSAGDPASARAGRVTGAAR